MGETTKVFTPPKRFRPFQADTGPWLIWSYYHNCWHRRSIHADGSEHATGYTNDIAQAGVFSEKLARAYHDEGPPSYRRNVSVPFRKVAAALQHAAAQRRSEADALIASILALSGAHPEPNTNEPKGDGG